MRSIKQIGDIKGKIVIVRVDFNVLIKNGVVEDDFRIKQTLPTIDFLKEKEAKIILISHRTEKGASLHPVADYLKIKLVSDFKLGAMENGEVVLLENLRNFIGEESNNDEFSKKLAKLGDIYVNDDFGTSHREHASIIGITKYLPSFMGLLFEKEFKNLSAVFKPQHPFLLILGGVKFKTKLSVLNKFSNIADEIFVGGALANNFLKAGGFDIKESIFDPEVDIQKFLNEKKIILPTDFLWHENKILDVGPETINNLKNLVSRAQFVLWNGPLGNYENGFDKGTLELAKIISESKAQSIIGGGDTVAAVKKVGSEKFSFVSTAGGAMLEFLANGTLPGIKALE